MRRLIVSSLLALVMGLPAVGTSTSMAQELQLKLGRDGPQVRMRDNCDPDREDCRGRGDDRRGDDRWSSRRECSPERALDKAERMGVRRARVDNVGRRTIDVRGRDRRGDRVVVTFDRRDGRCPVIGRF